MNYESPWTVLGVAPDADANAIRAAYAALLKQTNPEDDAEGFQRLRSAYESAMRHAQRRESARPDDDDFEDDRPWLVPSEPRRAFPSPPRTAEFENTDPHASPPHDTAFEDVEPDIPPPPAPPPPFEDTRPVSDIAEHTALCLALQQALLAKAPPETLRLSLEAVLAAPAMHRIDVFDRTAMWLVDLVHGTRPQSLVLVDRIIQFYGWKPQREELRQWQGPRAMFALRESIRHEETIDVLFTRLSDRRHEFHRAFELTRADSKALPERSHLEQLWALRHLTLVGRFLAMLKRAHGSAIARLNQASLDWWNERLMQPSLPYSFLRNARTIVLGLVLFTALITAMASVESDENLARRAAANPQDHYLAREACDYLARNASEPPGESDVTLAQAQAQCRTAIELMPDALSMHAALGIIALKQRDLELARSEFELVLASSPNHAVALYGLGLARGGHIAQSRTNEAERNMSRALALSPSVTQHFNYAQIVTPTDIVAADQATAFSLYEPAPPAFDTPPAQTRTPPVSEIEAAWAYFGAAPVLSRVQLRCLAKIDGTVTGCRVIEQSYYVSGEVALRLARGVWVTPAQLGGRPVDNAPITIPLDLRAAP